MKVPENVSSKTIHQIEKQLNQMKVPISLFKKLLLASMELNFESISDPIIKSRYLTSRSKISEYFHRVIYQNIYAGDDTYEEFIEFIITLFAIFDSLIQGRLYITDIAMQDSSVVSDFLDSYGFELNKIFENKINVDIAQDVYSHIRKKGTPQLLSMLLNHMGFSHYQIDEYKLNTIGGKYYLTPNTIFKSQSMKGSTITVEPVELAEIDDVLKTLNDDDLDVLYKHSLEVIQNV